MTEDEDYLMSNMDELCNRRDGGGWLEGNRVINVIEYLPDCDEFDHDKVTMMYMNRYGIENVRGGSFSNSILTSSQFEMLQRMIRHANRQCYTCGSSHHMKKNCNEEKWRQLNDRCFQCFDANSFSHSYKNCPNRMNSERLTKQKQRHSMISPNYDLFIKFDKLTNTNLSKKDEQNDGFFTGLFRKISNLF